MAKDIFIDTDRAVKFITPMDEEYKKLYLWLLDMDRSIDSRLVVSNKLLNEYSRSFGLCKKSEHMMIIVNKMTQEGRLEKKTNREIGIFISRYFTPDIENSLTCNTEDRCHIPIILLSERKLVLSGDHCFRHDLTNFPGFIVLAKENPADIPYDSCDD